MDGPYGAIVHPEVATVDDPRLDQYRSLRGRPVDEDAFVIEGVTTLRQALAAGIRPRSALVLPKKLHEVEDLGIPVHVATREVFESITGYDVHRGVLVLAERPPVRSLDEVLAGARRVVAMESITDSANVGSIFRNAAALGADAVVLDAGTADPLLRRSVRVSIGTVLSVPFATVPTWPDDLRGRGISLLALTPDATATPLDQVVVPERFALLVGTEGEGLTRAALDAADEHVRLPMQRGDDAVNVATALAIALYSLS
jgi:tRNA G18 (ribose-2'-O)-methylase SpoU